MASHHHCYHQQTQTHNHSTCSSCCCSCSSPHQLHSPSQPTDPLLLQAIANQLLQQQTQQQQQQQHLFAHYLNKPHQQNHQHHKQQKRHLHNDQEQVQAHHTLFTSLLGRIDALESSLHRLSSSSPFPSPAQSLRDLAARTIQTHFRAYLVRRSRTLRHLKHLAIIKSSFNSLKSSISDKPHFNPEALSQKAMDLLLKLDFIQGGDPMIRDGKRSISRELVRFLEFVDGVSAKRQQLCYNAMKKVRFAKDMEESRVYKVKDVGELDDQDVSSDDQKEALENLCEKIQNIEGFSRVYEDDEEENEIETEGASSRLSNGETNPRNKLRTRVNGGSGDHYQGRNGDSLFSAPLPVQMEPIIRDDLMKREKIVRVFR